MVDHEPSEFEKPEGRYDIEKGEVVELTRELLEEKSDRLLEKHRFVAIEVAGDSKYADIGRYVERVVFEETFGNDAKEMEEEYGNYESASRFYISIDRESAEPTGVLRVITPSEAGLKSYDDAAKYFAMDKDKVSLQPGMDDLDKVWDVGTIAVLPEYREKSGPVSILLERAMYVSAMENDVQAIVSIIHKKALRKMKSRWIGVGIPFKPLAGTAGSHEYLGSKNSKAVVGYVPEFEQKMLNHLNSIRGRMANRALKGALDRLIIGTEDDAIVLLDDYQKNAA